MYFISCFDANWMQNQRWFAELEPVPRSSEGKVAYLESAHRCFGYYPTKEAALEAVRANRGDIHECLYAWCVVEHVPPGIHGYSDEQPTWFRWQPGAQRFDGAWVETARPVETERILGFSIG